MSYKRKTQNSVEFVLKTEYNQGKNDIKKFREKCFEHVERQRTNRGAKQTIAGLLEKDFPGFKDHYPLLNWEQKSRKSDKTYTRAIVEKTYDDSLSGYSKRITEEVNKYGRKSNKKLNVKLEEQLNLESFMESAPKPMSNETDEMALISKLRDCGVKSYKRQADGSLEVQF